MEGPIDARYAPSLEWLQTNGRDEQLVNRLERVVASVPLRLRLPLRNIIVVLTRLVQ
jgi:hypothetical protein